MINAINLVVIYDPTKTDLPPIDLKNRGKKNKHDSQEQKFGVGGKYSVIDAVRQVIVLILFYCYFYVFVIYLFFK